MIRKATLIALVILMLLTSAYTQVGPSQNQSPAHVPEISQVNINLEKNRARFTAGSNLLQMRLEVYSGDGQRVFAGECGAGERIEWPTKNAAIPQGEYRYAVTSKYAYGVIGDQNTGTIVVREEGE